MRGMTETPEAPERVALHYTGTTPIRVAENANPNPLTAYPDSIIVVDRWAADILIHGEGFKTAAGTYLDDALRAANLSTSGTADEKRDRLATHEAQIAYRVIEDARAAANTDDTPES